MEKFLSMFVDIDTRVIYIAVVVILIAGLLAVIKKAVKLGIIVLIIALLVGYGGSFLNSIKERYDFSINGTELYVRVMNNEYNIELVDVKEINVQDLGNGNVKMEIYDTEGKAYTTPITINGTIYQLIKKQVSKHDIVVNER